MYLTFLQGFALSITLIFAIGAQNAFILRQGLRGAHIFWVCLVCGVLDAVLILAGIIGFGALAQSLPWFETAMRYGGAAFLLWYGWRNAVSAWKGGSSLEAADGAEQSLKSTLATLVALSLLNPHVYLDTVVLIGSISAQYEDRVSFGFGAVTASITFFFALGYGARLLRPIFANRRAWQILDALIALTMWAIAIKLVFF
ncbi:MAG: LysE/ArgO family amino acid transporter [Ascidiaceihabitans sp.]|jgi:L-lysine exporter family protein LysE/ArgO|nr:LysE/ArgO family amino acid transporter [Ascidiaceihabitans sp.]